MPDLSTMPSKFRIPDVAGPERTDEAVGHLKTYFGLSDGAAYTGAHFERLAGGGDRPGTRDVVCADDLIAVTMLSVEIRPTAALAFLEKRSAEITEHLQQIPTDLQLVDAPAPFFASDSPAHRLWRLFHSEPGIGWVTAGKLLARKRPHLIPVYDSVVRTATGGSDTYWQPLARALAADGRWLQGHLGHLRSMSGIGEDISTIRVFDVIVWMDHRRTHGAAPSS